MKKQAAIGLLAVSMLLAACESNSGGSLSSNSVDDSTSVSGSASTDSSVSSYSTVSSSSVLTPSEVLEGFLKKLEANNCTVTEQGYMVAKYLGEAELVTYDEAPDDPTGLLFNGDQGVFDYTVADNQVVIGQAAGSGTSFKEDFSTPYQLSQLASDVTVPASGYTYTVDPTSYFAAYAIAIDDWNPAYAIYGYVDSMSLTIQSDLSGASITYKLNSTYSYTITSVGSTADAVVEAYMANPIAQPARTAFTSDFLAGAANLFGEGNEVPFPSGLATELFRNDVTFADDNVTVESLSFSEFKAGDISESYAIILLADGFVAATGTDYYGDEVTYYEKELSPETATIGKSVMDIAFSYDSDYSEFAATITAYTYPKTYVGTDFGKANEILGAYNGTATTLFPLLSASDKVTAVKVEDCAARDGCKLFLDVTAAIAEEADATAYIAAFNDLAVAAGFTLETNYTWADDGYEIFDISGTTLSILVSGSFDSEGAYAGSIFFEFQDTATAA